jgi:amino acid permease
VIGGQLAIAFLVLFSYPLQCHPCRNSLDKVIPYSSEEEASLPYIPSGRFTAITVGIMASSYLIAISVSDLSIVLAFVGATGSTTICYILPGVFYYKLCENQRSVVASPRPFLQYAAGGMVIFGILIMFTSLVNIFVGNVGSH